MTEPNPEQPSSGQSHPESIVVSYMLRSGEYARYAAAAVRRNSNWKSFYVFLAVGFLAIPVALLFRFLAALSLHDRAAVELVGDFSLCAYGAGVGAAVSWWYINRSILRKRYYEGTLVQRELTTAVIDDSQITISFRGVEAKWQWAAVEDCRIERGLLLVWFGPHGAAIPCRCFESRNSCNKAMAFIRARLLEAKRAGAQPQA